MYQSVGPNEFETKRRQTKPRNTLFTMVGLMGAAVSMRKESIWLIKTMPVRVQSAYMTRNVCVTFEFRRISLIKVNQLLVCELSFMRQPYFSCCCHKRHSITWRKIYCLAPLLLWLSIYLFQNTEIYSTEKITPLNHRNG